jgi:hypothetical protein
MRHRIILVLLVLSFCLPALAQPSYWFTGFQRQGNAKLAQQYFFLAGSNISFTYPNDLQHVIINSSGGGGGTNAGPPGPTGPAGPQGPMGASGTNGVSATIAAGLVYTNAAGSPAGVTNRGTPTAAIFDFTLPVGPMGPQGPPGPSGSGGGGATNIWTTNILGSPVGSLVVDAVTHSNRFRVISPAANDTLFAAADFTLNYSGTYDSGNWANDYGSIEVANRDQTDGNVAYFSFSGHALSGYSTAVIGSVIRSHTGYGGDLFFWLRDPANNNAANNFATRMTIKGGGNVGIGTDLPTAGLQVYSLSNTIFKVSGTAGDNLFSVASSGVATGNAAGLTNAAHTLFNATNAPPGVLGYDGANWYWSTPSYGSLFVLKSGDTMSGSLSNWSGNVTIRSSNSVASLNFEVPSGIPGVWQGAFVQLSTNGNLYMGAPVVFDGGLHVEQFAGVDAGGISPTGVHYGDGSGLTNILSSAIVGTSVLWTNFGNQIWPFGLVGADAKWTSTGTTIYAN